MPSIIKRSRSLIYDCLYRFYDIQVSSLRATPFGLDNSVYFIKENSGSEYVFKIYETKSQEHIQNSLSTIQYIPKKFSSISYIPAKNGSLLSELDKRPCLLMKKLQGHHPKVFSQRKIMSYAEFMLGFHTSQDQSLTIEAEDFVTTLAVQLKKYLSPEVKNGITIYFPEFLDILDWVQTEQFNNIRKFKKTQLLAGITHGDLNPHNMLIEDNEFKIIDLDNIRLDGVQILDCLSFVAKTPCGASKKLTKVFYDTYCGRSSMNIERSDFEKLIILYSLMAFSSTFYYTFNIPKLTPEWCQKHAYSVLEQLYRTARNYLGNDAGASFGA